jgi:hypothetical protein
VGCTESSIRKSSRERHELESRHIYVAGSAWASPESGLVCRGMGMQGMDCVLIGMPGNAGEGLWSFPAEEGARAQQRMAQQATSNKPLAKPARRF